MLLPMICLFFRRKIEKRQQLGRSAHKKRQSCILLKLRGNLDFVNMMNKYKFTQDSQYDP